MPAQRPTCTRLRVRTPYDAHVIFHAVSLDLLPMVSRRLDTEERRSISSGCVFVWEERGPNPEATGVSCVSLDILVLALIGL
jgi:Gti1/Pac2 family transcription factor